MKEMWENAKLADTSKTILPGDLVHDGERVDDTGFGDIKIIQKPDEFCYGVDAVVLAAFAAVSGMRYRKDDPLTPASIADLGTGTGIIPLILSHKIQNCEILGIELQEGSYGRALRNVQLNGLSKKIYLLQGDVADRSLTRGFRGEFDFVTCNPPYYEGGAGLTGKNEAKHIARTETTGSLEDFVRTATELLKDKGDFYMIHRPSRLVDICVTCRKHALEPKEIRMIVPHAGEQPNIMLVHCVLRGGRELTMLPELAVYERNGTYTREILQMYERS